MKQKTKACPFCGLVGTYAVKDGGYYWLQCAVCEAAGPKTVIAAFALSEWNRRNAPCAVTDTTHPTREEGMENNSKITK